MGSEGDTGVSAGHQHSFCPLGDRGVGWEIPAAKASDGPCVGISSSVFQPFPMQCSSQRSECSPLCPCLPGEATGSTGCVLSTVCALSWHTGARSPQSVT